MPPDLFGSLWCENTWAMPMSEWWTCVRGAGFHAGLLGSLLVHLYFTNRAWRHRWRDTLLGLALFLVTAIVLARPELLPLLKTPVVRFMLAAFSGAALGFAAFNGALARWNLDLAAPDWTGILIRLLLPLGVALLAWVLAKYIPSAAAVWAIFVSQLALLAGLLAWAIRAVAWMSRRG